MDLDDDVDGGEAAMDWEPPTADTMPYNAQVDSVAWKVWIGVIAVGLVIGAAGAWVVLTLWDNATSGGG